MFTVSRILKSRKNSEDRDFKHCVPGFESNRSMEIAFFIAFEDEGR